MHRYKRHPCAFFSPMLLFLPSTCLLQSWWVPLFSRFLSWLWLKTRGVCNWSNVSGYWMGGYFFSTWVTPQMPEVIQDFKWLGPHTHTHTRSLHRACTRTHPWEVVEPLSWNLSTFSVWPFEVLTQLVCILSRETSAADVLIIVVFVWWKVVVVVLLHIKNLHWVDFICLHKCDSL